MNKNQVIEKIKKAKIIPVIRTASAEQAKPIIKALIEGGIDVLEITMTIPNGVKLIAELTEEYQTDALIGAGTVLDEETAQKCAEAGAKFIVSPLTDLKTISFCNGQEIVVMPGAITPTEIYNAWKAGADVVKIFPVNSAGGVSFLRSVKAVFPNIEIVPTGGINLENAASYLEAGALAVGMGSELTKNDGQITARAKTLRENLGVK